MEHLTESTLLSFLLQVALFWVYIPVSYLAYRWVRAPLKLDRVRLALSQLGIVRSEELEEVIAGEYRLKHFIWPLSAGSLVIASTYSMTHPYPLLHGLWAGIPEEVINVFGVDNPLPRVIAVGRVWAYAWFGAYIYSFQLTMRRLLAYDLSPSVYIFTANRFLLAFSVGAIIIIGMGTFSTAAGVPRDVNMATVAIIAFFIGFFPEQGINWITATAQKALKQQGGIVKETRLSEIEGLSIWHQGRLKQEGIENVQNLATADVPGLVVSTPFAVTQIIDWVDQAVLLAHTDQVQFERLEKASVIRASEVLTNTSNAESLDDIAEATGLKKGELRVLSRGLHSALNLKLVARFRWQSSLDVAKVQEAQHITT